MMSNSPEELAEPSTSPMTENTFLNTAAGSQDPPPPLGGLRRLMVWIVPANFGIFLVWNTIPAVLLPQQVTLMLGEENKVANLAIASTVGALAGMIAQPIAGQLSDRTRSRFGRRTPWIVLGALAGALTLIGLAFAETLVGIVIAWVLVQVSFNFVQAPLSAVLPDRVPIRRRGTFASIAAIGLMAGAFGGSIIGSVFFNSVSVGYIVLAVISFVALTLFVVFNRDYPSTGLAPDPFDLKAFLRTFWVSPIRHPDFFWAFSGRILLYSGYFAVTGYQLFLLTDYFGEEHPETIIPLLALLAVVGILSATLISGPLSDRIGRRKPFVFASAFIVSLAFAVPWIWQDTTAWFVMTFLAALGFGMFQAVDTALISEVLPSAKSFAKDLGVVNIALMLPQTLAAGLSGVIVLLFGYQGLFPVAILLGILGAFAVLPIKSTR